MNNFQNRYGLKENEITKEYHRKRRMFCIYNNELKIAQPYLIYSHAEWFEKEGWITKENDSLMDEIVRGYVNEKEEIYFYTGYDFRVNEHVEKVLFSYLGELLNRFDIKKENCKIYGGMKKEKGSRKWVPLKEYKGKYVV